MDARLRLDELGRVIEDPQPPRAAGLPRLDRAAPDRARSDPAVADPAVTGCAEPAAPWTGPDRIRLARRRPAAAAALALLLLALLAPPGLGTPAGPGSAASATRISTATPTSARPGPSTTFRDPATGATVVEWTPS